MSHANSQQQQQLAPAQQECLQRALAYAAELQQTIYKDLAPQTTTLNPGLAGGGDARSLALLSRIYVGSINFDLTESHLRQVFAEYGPIASINMSRDSATGKHKGFGFVEYAVPEAAALALDSMGGTMLGGRQLKLGRPNNYNPDVIQTLPSPPDTRVYVANINEAIDESGLREIFAAFGTIDRCVLAGKQGWGFVEFAGPEAAEQTALAMNGFSLGTQVLRVCKCVVGGPLADSQQATVEAEAEAAAETANNDDMQKLSISTSCIVLLENVVGGPDEIDDELAEDMAGESMKCGEIERVVVHIGSENDGLDHAVTIFVQYKEPEAAKRALDLFNGRWFAGRQVAARLFDTDRYQKITSADTMVFIP